MVMKRKFIGRTVPRKSAGGKLTPKKSGNSPVDSAGSAETVCGVVSPFSEEPVFEASLHPAVETEGESETVCGNESPFASIDDASEDASSDANPASAPVVETSLHLAVDTEGESETVCGNESPFALSDAASEPAIEPDPVAAFDLPEMDLESLMVPEESSEAATICGDLPVIVDESEKVAVGSEVFDPFAPQTASALAAEPIPFDPFAASAAQELAEDESGEAATICGDATPFELASEDLADAVPQILAESPQELPFDSPVAAVSSEPVAKSETAPGVAPRAIVTEGSRATLEVPVVSVKQAAKSKEAEKEDVQPKKEDTTGKRARRHSTGEFGNPEASDFEKDSAEIRRRQTAEIPKATASSSDSGKFKTSDSGKFKTSDSGKFKTSDSGKFKTSDSGKFKTSNTKSGNTGRNATTQGGSNTTKDGVKKRQQAFDFHPGDMVNHYELIRLLGKGGMGSVFMARDTKLGRRVAIKFLHTKDQELARRFILEARTTARVGHENIVIIYEADEFNGMPYMVLEYLQGTTLTKLIENNQPMPPGRVAELMAPVLRALVRAHAEGIVHRDLKPDNVMLTDSGTVKVLDFGISKVMGGDDKDESDKADKNSAKNDKGDKADDRSGLTRSGAIVGTLAYMSPEQWRAKGIDHRTDLWATGIMLFRMLTGKHPLDGKSGMELAIVGDYKHKMPSLRDVMPNLPSDLIDLVDKSLAKRKEHRCESASEMLEILETFLPGRTRKLKIDQSPYAGLSAFQEADADRFFGRNNEIAAVVNRIRDQALLGIVGASGSGKSSIVRAGVLPALKRSGENWECLVIRPGRNPLKALAEVLSPMSASMVKSKDDLEGMSKLTDRIRTEPGYAGSLLRSKARKTKTHQLLFIDQFEELYTQVSDLEERLAFTASLTSIADDPSSPTRIILSIRSDFLDRVAEDMTFMTELSQGLIFLIAPNRNGLRDAIVQPAEMAGFTFESQDIVNEMLDHLASTPGALPLLQFAASKLWENRDTQRKMLTTMGYRALGGIAGALATHADSVLNEFTSSGKDLARAIFLRLITPERTRAIVSVSELNELSKDTDELKRVIDQLVRARLLVVQTSGGNATVEIVHESLVHTWPTLKRWLDETGEDAPFLENLRNATKQWQSKNCDKDQLWHGKMADEAERFLEKNKLAGIPDAQIDYLKATVKLKRAVARRKKIITVGVAMFLVFLGVGSTIFAIYAFHLKGQADENSKLAESEKIRAESALVDAKESQKKAEASQKVAEEEKKRAEDSLLEVQKKEAERSAAEARARKAAEDLELKNKDLLGALSEAERAQKMAKRAQLGAERNAKLARKQEQLARQAEERALKAAQEVAALLMQEQERVQRLQDQLGSPVIDDLK